MTTKGALIAASVAGFFASMTPVAMAADKDGDTVMWLQGPRRVQERQERLRGKERMHGGRDDQDHPQGVRGQGGEGHAGEEGEGPGGWCLSPRGRSIGGPSLTLVK